jgi:hypothetical protein
VPRLLAVLALLTFAAPASADVRHATPGGATTGDCKTTACDFPTAVTTAQPGDEVEVAPGNYGSEASPIAGVYTYGAIQIHGRAGQPRPRIFSAPANPNYYALALFGAGASVAHLELTAVGTQSSSVALALTGATANDVVIQSKVSNGAAACNLQNGAVMRSSVCWTPSIQNPPPALREDPQAANTNTITLSNVTAVALGSGGSGLYLETDSGKAVTVNAVNSVIEGLVAVAYRERNPGNGTIEFNPTYSNIVGAGGNNFCNPDSDCTQTPSSTNLAGNAIFVNLAGNYHQDPMSPTINRGTDSALSGATDFDGQPRIFGGRIDIGADELVRPPFVTTTAATSVSAKGAILNGRANPRGVAKTEAFFEFGRTKAYGSGIGFETLAPNSQSQRVASSLGGLKPSTRYHFRLVATGPGGRTTGADRTFKTTGPFTGLVLPAAQTVEVPKATAKVQAKCPASANTNCKGTLALSRKGSRGKRVALGQASIAIPRGTTRKVPVPLNDGAVGRLDDRGHIGARATARVTDGSGGASHTTSGKVMLERPGQAARKLAAGR